MPISNYGMQVIKYSFDGKRIEVEVQFYHEFLGICTSTAYGWFTGDVLSDGDVVWNESGRAVADSIEQRLDAVYRKARKKFRLRNEQEALSASTSAGADL